MAKQRDIAVRLTAKTGTFVRSMRSATNALKGFGKISGDITRAIGSLKGAVVGAAGIGGVGIFVKRMLDLGERTDLASRKLGVAAEELQRLSFIARHTGVDARKLEIGLQRMTRRVSEAADTGGPLEKALNEIGLSAEKIVKQSPDKIFRDMSEGFKSLPTQADRVRIAFKLFDTEGVDLVNTLALGGEELERLARRADATGKIMSAIEAHDLRVLKNAMIDLKDLVQGTAFQMFQNFVPAMTEMADRIFNVAIQSDQLKKVAEAPFQIMNTAILTVGVSIDNMITKFLEMEKIFLDFKLGFGNIADRTGLQYANDLLALAFGKISEGASAVGLKDLGRTFENLAVRHSGIAEEFANRELSAEQQELAARISELSRMINERNKGIIPEGESFAEKFFRFLENLNRLTRPADISPVTGTPLSTQGAFGGDRRGRPGTISGRVISRSQLSLVSQGVLSGPQRLQSKMAEDIQIIRQIAQNAQRNQTIGGNSGGLGP